MMNIFMFTCFVVLFNQDSIMYNLSVNEDEKAMKMIKKIYHKDENHEEILQNLKEQVYMREEKEELPIIQSLFSKKNLWCTIICVVVGATNIQNGSCFLLVCSNRIITQINSALPSS